MMVYITSINFNYGDYSDGFANVTFRFTTTGASYTLDGEITVSKEVYMEKSGDIGQLRQLIKDKVIADLSQ